MSKTKLRKMSQSVVLCILDGWGEREESDHNAIAMANTPNWDRLSKTQLKTSLSASGECVGLPQGQMGNSEVGHMSIGSGRIVLQDLPRIDAAIADNSFEKNVNLRTFITHLQRSGGVCHLLGLLSPGGVHSHQAHMTKLSKILHKAGVPTRVHAFLDGRDTPPTAAKDCIHVFTKNISKLKDCQISSLSGRYWAMDRDSNWDRVKVAYEAIILANGDSEANALMAISKAYENNITDEFLKPTVIGDYAGARDGDGLLMANFRAARVRQILNSFVEQDFHEFYRPRICQFASCLGMVEYSSDLNTQFNAILPQKKLERILGQLVSEAAGRQLRIAETEKYAHVTFFFNGGREKPFIGEQRILIKSPNVDTYDLQPEMSSIEVTDKLVQAIGSCEFDLIVVNYANGDMVGHTGVLKAAVEAVDILDVCLGRVEAALKEANSVMLVTADHGNCEMMYDVINKEGHTQHTLNKVPALLVNAPSWVTKLKPGRLCDVAPTVLRLLGLPQPTEMTGFSLIEEGKVNSDSVLRK